MELTQMHYAKRKKKDIKDDKLYDSIYRTLVKTAHQ